MAGTGVGRGRFLKPDHLNNNVYSTTPHRTAPAKVETRSEASSAGEGDILTITPDLGCSDSEGPRHAMLAVTSGHWLYWFLLHHQMSQKLS